jgi:hypothetical protein
VRCFETKDVPEILLLKKRTSRFGLSFLRMCVCWNTTKPKKPITLLLSFFEQQTPLFVERRRTITTNEWGGPAEGSFALRAFERLLFGFPTNALACLLACADFFFPSFPSVGPPPFTKLSVSRGFLIVFSPIHLTYID